MKLNLKKCLFGRSRVEYLGHEVDRDGIRMASDEAEGLSTAPKPYNQDGVRRFLGAANYYQRFIDKFAEKALPLT